MNRTLSAIFCDDVRQEMGNKLSYMGCYIGRMFVLQFPIVLPKFCVVMMASTLASNPFQQLKFRLLKNDEVIAEHEADVNMLTLPPLQQSDSEGEEVRQTALQVVQVIPLQIHEPCKFRARAITESGELRGGSLVVSAPT